MSRFLYNDCDVCEDPEYVIREKHKTYTWSFLEISISEYNGKWFYGYQYEFESQGGGCLPSKSNMKDHYFLSKEIAINAAIQFLMNKCNSRAKTKMVKQIMNILNDYRKQHPFYQQQLINF